MELTQRQQAELVVLEEKAILFEFAEQIAGEVVAAQRSGKLLPEELDASWQDKAKCGPIEGDGPFFPKKGDYMSNREARSLCLGCKVLESCMRSSFLYHERYGIRAGLSDGERRKFLAAARREKAA